MESSLEINGRILRPIRDVAEQVAYSRDYITRLAREKKVYGVQIKRQWFVDVESVRQYAADADIEASVRKQSLSEIRKQERELRSAVAASHERRERKRQYGQVIAGITSGAVVCAGLLFGVAAYDLLAVESAGGRAASASVSNMATTEAKLGDESVAPLSAVTPVHEATTTVTTLRPETAPGVLLLPTGATTSAMSDLFSDDVELQVSDTGTMVTPVNAAGEPVGASLPLISVPVQSNN